MNDRTLAELEEQPLFFDEPPDLPKPQKVNRPSIEDLFPSEDDYPLTAPPQGTRRVDWQEMNALDPRAVQASLDLAAPPIAGRGRTSLALALILAAAALGFTLVAIILE